MPSEQVWHCWIRWPVWFDSIRFGCNGWRKYIWLATCWIWELPYLLTPFKRYSYVRSKPNKEINIHHLEFSCNHLKTRSVHVLFCGIKLYKNTINNDSFHYDTKEAIVKPCDVVKSNSESRYWRMKSSAGSVWLKYSVGRWVCSNISNDGVRGETPGCLPRPRLAPLPLDPTQLARLPYFFPPRFALGLVYFLLPPTKGVYIFQNSFSQNV